MDRITNAQDARENMLKSCKYYETRIKAWENVKRQKTKNGQDFKILSKNFTNCTFLKEYGDNKIYIYFKDETGAYNRDYINLSGNSYKQEITTADALEFAILETIENYKTYYEMDKAGAAAITEQIKNINDSLLVINKVLHDAENVNTHYTLKAYIKHFLSIY